jgi:hypothetical protein
MAGSRGRFENAPRHATPRLHDPKVPALHKEQHLKTSLWVSTVLGTALLGACGGGSSDQPAAGPTPLALTGVAATGAAIAGQTVEAKCSTGTGTATSNADGSYTISVDGGRPAVRPEDHARLRARPSIRSRPARQHRHGEHQPGDATRRGQSHGR